LFFRQILQDDLGCASYIVADGGEAVVVDPKWEIAEYLEAAEEAGARIRHVVETHNYADHVSGRLRLVEATGAEVHLPADPDHPEAGGVRPGDVIRIGAATLRALAAPGHRPEHLAFAVRGGDGSPSRLLSGDSLLVGAVARPDLAVDAETGADALYDTLRRLEALGDEVEVWPAHVGASLCGSGSGDASEATFSTIGDERSHNPLLGLADRSEFVSEITRSSPTRPPRVESVVALNLIGAEPPPPLDLLSPGTVRELVTAGTCVLDIRMPDRFDRAYLRDSLNLAPAGKGLGNRAGWATRVDEPIVIAAPSFDAGARFAQQLYAAGIRNLEGIAVVDPERWALDGLDVRVAASLSPEAVAAGLAAGELTLIDVRDPGEWRLGHLPGSVSLPLSMLGDGGQVNLPVQESFAVACASGARAALAASILRRSGHERIARMTDGIDELARFGPPLVTGD
jgi:hydroxyacylglutathione hydrolase